MPDAIHVRLPDGSEKAAPVGTPIGDFVKTQIGAGLAKAAVLARYNGQLVDLSTPLKEDGKLEVLTNKAPEALETIRHDAAHVVASVVQRLFPGTQVTIGPTIEDGFYYDFSREHALHARGPGPHRGGGQRGAPEGPSLRAHGGVRRRGHPPL